MKKYKKWITAGAVLFLITMAVFVGAALRQQNKNTPYSLIYIPKADGGKDDFWTSLISGARMAAKEYSSKIQIMAPETEQDVERQNELLSEAIRQKPDAILFSPSSFTESDELLKQAKTKGIPVVFIDSYVEEDVQDITVSTDNLEAGKKLGEYAKSLLNKDSEIAVVSHVQGVSTAVEREAGFCEGLGSYEENIVEVVYCDSLFEKSYELTKDLMEKYPNLELIAGMNEFSSVGAARAVRDAGKEGKIKIIGVDSSQEAVDLMERGVFQGIVVQRAFKMGYLGVKETIRMLDGEKVEKKIDSGCELVTPENMYDSEIEKLIFPFNIAAENTTE